MPYVSLFVVSFTIALTGALAPGPLLAAVIYESAKRGAAAGPLIVVGHAIVEMAMVALLMFGAAKFINNPLVLKGITLAGGCIFLIFGAQMLLSLPKATLTVKTTSQKPSNLALTGITLSLANPYWALWWLTIGLGLVLGAKQQGWFALVVFFLGHILADLGWYSAVSLAMSKGKKFISDKLYRILIGICAATLVGFGVYFGLQGVDVLFF